MYKKYINTVNSYQFDMDFQINKRQLFNVFLFEYNKKIFDQNKKRFYWGYGILYLIGFIFLLISIISRFYFSDKTSLILMICIIVFSVLFVLSSFIVGGSYTLTRPYSLATLLCRSYTFVFNLNWYYLYYLFIIYKKYDDKKANEFVKKVFKPNPIKNTGYWYPEIMDYYYSVEENPLTHLMIKMYMKYNVSKIDDEQEFDNTIIENYTEKQLIKEIKKPYIMFHCCNVFFLLIMIATILITVIK